MLVQLLSLVALACLFGLVASVVVYRAGSMAPVWSIAIAVLVLLLLTAAVLAILVFAKNRAFPN
jgi:predicted membrane-bound mannosyltransferase